MDAPSGASEKGTKRVTTFQTAARRPHTVTAPHCHAAQVLSLEDPLHTAGGPKSERGKGGAVRGLAWVLAAPARLAIVLASGAFLVWDVDGACPTMATPALPQGIDVPLPV